MKPFTIKPIKTGTVVVDKGWDLTSGIGLGTKVEIPSIAWYLTDGTTNIMVDTGMCHTELADWHRPGSWQGQGEALPEQLKTLGINPSDVDFVIYTHLHWDHCHNLEHFFNAELIVNTKEYEYAANPAPPYYKAYEHPCLGMQPPFAKAEFTKIDGEFEIVPGIIIFPTPGHTVGHQSVSVETENGVYVVAGDAIYLFENLRALNDEVPYTPIGGCMDSNAAWRSITDITQIADYILPGHDSKVFDSPTYPIVSN